MQIRRLSASDRDAYLNLRSELWPELSAREHAEETELLSALDRPYAVFVAARDDGRLLGFLEASLREHADGCLTCPVGYVEGWYVAADGRRAGAGRALIDRAAEWTREHGCSELASDADPANADGRAAHGGVGFEEVGELVHYRMDVGDGAAAADDARAPSEDRG